MTYFDVGIIGAGIHGVSTAYHLASRGLRPIIFDKGAPASGPTGRSSAICRAYYTNEFLAEVAHDSLEMFRNFKEVTAGRDAGFHTTGMLYLHPQSDAVEIKKTALRLNRIGTRVRVYDRKDLGQLFPMFNLSDIGLGAWESEAGYADPVGTTSGLLQRAVELGAVARLYCDVVAIHAVPKRGIEILTGDGDRTTTGRVLIAAGPWSKDLAAQVGVRLPLTVERHIVATIRWNEAKRIPYGHVDLIEGYYCKPEGDEMYCIGPLHAGPHADPEDFAETISDEEVDRMGRLVVRRVPELKSALATGGWASLYDVSPDWQPVIGEISDGVFIDAGTSGHGFKLAPALGLHVADLLTDSHPDPRLEQFHPRRFSSGISIAGGYGEARILG